MVCSPSIHRESPSDRPGSNPAAPAPPNAEGGRSPLPFPSSGCATRRYHSRSRVLSLAIDWLCNWHTRLSVTFSTAAISFRFMSCS